MSKFGDQLKRARENSGLTQKELAERVGIDDSYISRIERGSPPPARDKVLSLVQALGISGKAERATFLLAAGCASTEDLEGIAEAGEHGEGEEEDMPLIFSTGSLHFPRPEKLEEEALVEELRALLSLARMRNQKWQDIVELLRSFFAWVRFRMGEKK
jgi:transcriptional regulator with XRE-family HTH domain